MTSKNRNNDSSILARASIKVVHQLQTNVVIALKWWLNCQVRITRKKNSMIKYGYEVNTSTTVRQFTSSYMTRDDTHWIIAINLFVQRRLEQFPFCISFVSLFVHIFCFFFFPISINFHTNVTSLCTNCFHSNNLCEVFTYIELLNKYNKINFVTNFVSHPKIIMITLRTQFSQSLKYHCYYYIFIERFSHKHVNK